MSSLSLGVTCPPDWPRKRIKYVCRFVGGGTPDKSIAEYWDGDIPWVSPKDMKRFEITDTEDHITEKGLASSAANMVAPGAVLLVMRSGILRHSIPVAINTVTVTLNQDMRGMILQPQFDARYVARLIEGHQQELLTIWSKEGTTVESLESELVQDTAIAVPPLSQQRAIADYLDRETARLDALIAAKERLLDLLAEKRRALITHAVTRGLDPNAPLRDSGIPWLGAFPAHWGLERAKFLFRQSALPVQSDDEMVTCFRDGQVTLRRNRREEGFTNANLELGYQGIRRGQLVLHSMDAFAGAIGVSDSDGKCSPEYIICDPQSEATDNAYYGHLLRTMALAGFIQASCSAVRERAPRIRFSDFGEMFFPVPPRDEQPLIVVHIAKRISHLDILRAATERTIALLKERRAALIAAAVTGQVDVESPS